MRVLIVSKAFVSAAYRQKLRELRRLGIEAIGAAPAGWREGGRILPLEQDDGEAALRITRMRLNGHFHLHWYPDIPRLLDEIQPDILHMDEEPYNVATYHAVRSARRKGVPALFFTWQNLLRRYPPPFRWIEKAVYGTCQHAIAGSADAAHVLRSKDYRGHITVIPQFGVDPNVFSPAAPPGGAFRIGFFNRLVLGKDPLLLLRAFERLPAETELVIVGDGPLSAEVQEAAIPLAGRVSILPRVPSSEMPDLMRSVHVVALPSRTMANWKEQFGRVIMEAMAAGVPVIGSDSGEIPHVIGDAGIVVPEQDEEALYRALWRLLEDPALRADLAGRGRARVLERFTHARIAEQTAGVYHDVLSGSA